MDTTEKVPSTRERQAQQRREKIIQASMQLFWGLNEKVTSTIHWHR